MHAYAPDEAEKLNEHISSEFNCAELWVSEFSPVMGYATGTGTLARAFYKEYGLLHIILKFSLVTGPSVVYHTI